MDGIQSIGGIFQRWTTAFCRSIRQLRDGTGDLDKLVLWKAIWEIDVELLRERMEQGFSIICGGAQFPTKTFGRLCVAQRHEATVGPGRKSKMAFPKLVEITRCGAGGRTVKSVPHGQRC